MDKDSEIIRLILEGDRNQYRILVERYQHMVFRTCMGFVHNREDAEELAQDVFIRAYEALPGFRQESAFSTWLYRIALNRSLNHTRKKSKYFFLKHIDDFLGINREEKPDFYLSDGENPESMLISEEKRVWVQKALDSLPEKQRIAIVLSKYDDMSQKEIAEIMKTTEGAVEALLQRAKANLRTRLAGGKKK